MRQLGSGSALVVGLVLLASACGDSGDTTTTTSTAPTTTTSTTAPPPSTTAPSTAVDELVEIALAAVEDAEAAELRVAALREQLDEARRAVDRQQADVDGWRDVLDDPDETVTAELAVSYAEQLDQAEERLEQAMETATTLEEEVAAEEAVVSTKREDAVEATDAAVEEARRETGGDDPDDRKCEEGEEGSTAEEEDDDDDDCEPSDPVLPALESRFERLRGFCQALGGGEGTPNQPIGWAFAPMAGSFEGLFGGCGGGGPASLEALLAIFGDVPGVFSTELGANLHVVVFPADLLTQTVLDELTEETDVLPVDAIPAIDETVESAYVAAEPEEAAQRLTPSGAIALDEHLTVLPAETFFLQAPDALGTYPWEDIPLATPELIHGLPVGSLHQLDLAYLDAVVADFPDPGIESKLSSPQHFDLGSRTLGATDGGGSPPPTTRPPTTRPPTTSPPTTVPPTTVPPTTVPPTTVPPTTVPPSTVPPSTVPPSTVPPTTVPPTTVPPTTVPPTTTPPTTMPPTTTTAPPDVTAPQVSNPSASPGLIYSEGEPGCARTSTISVTVTDNVGVAAVRGVYGAGLPGSPMTFSRSGSRWSAQFGPFPGLDSGYAEHVAIGIIATDAAGNEAGTNSGVTVIGFCVR